MELEYMHLGQGLSIRQPDREGKRFGIVGKSGSGKTNSLLVLARQLIEAGWVVDIIDPMNQFRRLRDAGLPVIVAGARDSADVKMTPENAEALAALSFDERVSMVLDVSMYADDMEVLQPFLEALWKRILMQHEDGPFVRYALIIDEAQIYIPQGGKTAVSSLILDMGKRGRQLHLSMAIASQRPASVQKDFLTQSNVMIFHQLRGVDIVPLKDELAIPEKEARQMMKQFIKGEAMVVGDTDMIELGESDYVMGRVQEWNGVPAAESVSAGTRTGAIDAALLERIRTEVNVKESAPQPPLPLPIDQSELEALRKQNNDLQLALARMNRATLIGFFGAATYQRMNAKLQQELEASRSEHKDEVVKKSWSIPALEIEGKVEKNGQFKITRQTTHIETVEGSYQSTRQLAIKVKRQESAFADLLNTVRQLRTNCIAILLEALSSVGGYARLEDVAMEYDYALSTVPKGMPDLLRTGLVTRTEGGDIQSCVDAYLASSFPALNAEQLRERLAETVEMRLERG